jgi:hypothetical protein
MLNQVQHDCVIFVRCRIKSGMTMRVSFLFPHVIPANAGILFRQCRRFEMLNQVQHDVRYICEMPDHVRHDGSLSPRASCFLVKRMS